MDQESSPTFAIILKTVPEGNWEQEELARRFSEEFHLKEDLSRKLLGMPPVILFNELSRGQVSDVKPPLKVLSEEFDVQFLITSAEVFSMPELKWPEHPDPEGADEETVYSNVELEVHDGTLVCPTCEHILVLDYSGDRLSGSVLTQGSDIESLRDQVEIDEKETVSMDRSLSSMESGGTSDSDVDLSEFEEETDSADEEGVLTGDDPEAETVSQEEVNKEEPSNDTSAAFSPGTATGNTNVFISSMPDTNREEVVDLLAEVRNCSASEAEELIDRPITPIMNGVTEEEANELKKQFNNIGVNVNIVNK